MKNDITKFFKTTEFLKTEIEPTELEYEREKIIGTPVKVMRTGKDKPDKGWHVAQVYFQKDKENIDQPFVKVRKPDKEDPKKRFEKIVPLQILEKINPEIKFLIFERDKDFVLYEDEDHNFKIGLVVNVILEEESLLVMLSPERDDTTAPLDRVIIANIIDKSNDLKQLEKIFQDKVRKRSTT
jgi:hypothetical protein